MKISKMLKKLISIRQNLHRSKLILTKENQDNRFSDKPNDHSLLGRGNITDEQMADILQRTEYYENIARQLSLDPL